MAWLKLHFTFKISLVCLHINLKNKFPNQPFYTLKYEVQHATLVIHNVLIFT